MLLELRMAQDGLQFLLLLAMASTSRVYLNSTRRCRWLLRL